MNEDKELEEAINNLEKLMRLRKNKCGEIKFDTCICETKDLETVLKALNNKNEIINLMALAILNYDDQLVINKYRDLEDVKNHFQELSKED